MKLEMTPTNIEYVAKIEDVKEVMLYGTADLDFWTKRLSAAGLRPSEKDRRAEILLSATNLKWRGARFNEFVISIGVQHAGEAGFYLPQAFNSLRFFAFSERTFFKTPYDHANVTLSDHLPAAMGVTAEGVVALHAQMAQARPCQRSGAEMWQGPIYLPRHQQFFIARLSGLTEVYEFQPADSINIQPAQRFAVFQWLSASGFTPHEWRIRHAASHAKSKTYSRTNEK